jgi:hypothetical protein
METPRPASDLGQPPDGPNVPVGYDRHFLGTFGESIIAHLGRHACIGKIADEAVFVVVDSIELGDNPLDEEIGVEFHLSSEPSRPDHIPYWGRLAPGRIVEQSITPGMNPIRGETSYSFVFTSATPLEENLGEFLDFIAIETGLIPDVNPDSPARGDRSADADHFSFPDAQEDKNSASPTDQPGQHRRERAS